MSLTVNLIINNHRFCRLFMYPPSIGSPLMDGVPRAESNVILDSILTYYTNMTETHTHDDGSQTPTALLEKQTPGDGKHTSNLMTNPIAIKDIGEFPLPPPHADHPGSNESSTANPLTISEHYSKTPQALSSTPSQASAASQSQARCAQVDIPNISFSSRFQPLRLIGSPRIGIFTNNSSKSPYLSSLKEDISTPRALRLDIATKTELWYDRPKDEVDDVVEQSEAVRDAGLRKPDWRAQASRSKPAVKLAGNEAPPATGSSDRLLENIQTMSTDKEFSWINSHPATLQVQLPTKHRGSLQSEDSFWNLELLPASQQRLLDRHSMQSISRDDDTIQCLDQLDEATRNINMSDSGPCSLNSSDEQADSEQQMNYADLLESPSFASCFSAIRDLESSLRSSSNSTSSYYNHLLSCTGTNDSEFHGDQEESSWPSRSSSLDASIPDEAHTDASKNTDTDTFQRERTQQVLRPFLFVEPEGQTRNEPPLSEQHYIESAIEGLVPALPVKSKELDLRGLCSKDTDLTRKSQNSFVTTRKRSATQYNPKVAWPLPAGRADRTDGRQRSNTQPSQSVLRTLGNKTDQSIHWKEKTLPALPCHAVIRDRQPLEEIGTNLPALQDKHHISNTNTLTSVSTYDPVLTRQLMHKSELHKSLPALPEDLDTSAIAAAPLSKEVPLPGFTTTREISIEQADRVIRSLDAVLATSGPLPPPMVHFRDSRYVPHSMEDSAATSEEERSPSNMRDLKSLGGEIHDAYVIRPYDLEQDSVGPNHSQNTPSLGDIHEQSTRNEQTETPQHIQDDKRSRRGCTSAFLHFWANLSCSASPTRAARTRSPAETA